MRGPALRRDHVIAASLAGAVVIVVGYASGIGLRPGTAAATPPVVADGGHPPAAPQTPAPQPLPVGQLPTGGPPSPLPAVPVGDVPAAPMPSMPGAVPIPDPGSPDPGSPPSSPPPSTSPAPPPGTDVPTCQPGVPQQVLDTVGGLPLLGAVTSGLGVTGPDGVGALVLGYCRNPDGGLEPAMVPATAVTTVPSGR
ncbi:hypothetical protein SAMN04489727_5753 [Amycolatopsis tolypomycina]|uniref:Uncharacterized protein n=1 Tax=Amycolatopsis tolypomycina TaxID=208445 RepID=A0A1H4WR46_9PSEU|nr:hypothetical protein [Amycolatopsis tolypomycina]SEC95769.1 hypothetical protein SAMN04489727_5753 [Amycolatopsis tolypomycina]